MKNWPTKREHNWQQSINFVFAPSFLQFAECHVFLNRVQQTVCGNKPSQYPLDTICWTLFRWSLRGQTVSNGGGKPSLSNPVWRHSPANSPDTTCWTLYTHGHAFFFVDGHKSSERRPSLKCVTNSGRIVADAGRLVDISHWLVAISHRFVSFGSLVATSRHWALFVPLFMSFCAFLLPMPWSKSEKCRNFWQILRLGLEHTT